MKPLSMTLTLAAVLAFPAQAIPLAPVVAGSFTNGDGANSLWVQVADDWRGSIFGSEPWGTGIWGLADQAQVLGLSAGQPGVVRTARGTVASINFADQRFIDDHGAQWGSPTLAPIFSGGEAQDNWASRFTGYLAIPTAGRYNFGILYDDGFRFTLGGASASATLEIDGLNPRDRLGFDSDLELEAGLYEFTLDAYERLEAGVVQLAWFTPGAGDWTVVPQGQLFTSPVPEPGPAALLASGLLGLLAWRRVRSTPA